MAQEDQRDSLLTRILRFGDGVFAAIGDFFSARLFTDSEGRKFVLTLGVFGDVIPFRPALLRNAETIAQVHMWAVVVVVLSVAILIPAWGESVWQVFLQITSLVIIIFHLRELILWGYIRWRFQDYIRLRNRKGVAHFAAKIWLERAMYYGETLATWAAYFFYIIIFASFMPYDHPDKDEYYLSLGLFLFLIHFFILMRRLNLQRLVHGDVLYSDRYPMMSAETITSLQRKGISPLAKTVFGVVISIWALIICLATLEETTPEAKDRRACFSSVIEDLGQKLAACTDVIEHPGAINDDVIHALRERADIYHSLKNEIQAQRDLTEALNRGQSTK